MNAAGLPLFVRLAGRPVILIGEGDAAEAKRRLLERAGATIVAEEAAAALAIVALASPDAAVARLRARGVLVNAVDRPDLCDFTLPAIVDRAPVILAVGTGGVSAGLAAALRQRLEAWLPANVGRLAEALHAARPALRARWPAPDERRRALAHAMGPGGALDPFADGPSNGAIERWILDGGAAPPAQCARIVLRSADPDELTLREARWLARADRVLHRPGVAGAILDRARADAPRTPCAAPPDALEPGLTVWVEGP